MTDIFWIIVIFQILYQMMFISKNIILTKKLGKNIRGKNKEANISILFFVLFIGLAVFWSAKSFSIGYFGWWGKTTSIVIAGVFLSTSFVIAASALIGLRDSWRVGVVEEDKTELVTNGIYRFSRNPYFASYLLMFWGYSFLLQNWIFLALSFIGWWTVHQMILKEEQYLLKVHGETYKSYQQRTPRYLLF